MSAQIEANNAKQLLENPRLQQAFVNVKENIVLQLEYTPIGEHDARTELVVSLQVLKAIQQDIENDINTGVLELAG